MTFLPLCLAFALFLAAHSLPSLPGLRARLVARLGERRYLLAHSLVALGSLIWLVAETLAAPRLDLWGHPLWARWVPVLVMPLVCFLLVAGLSTPNPFSLGIGGKGYRPDRPGIVGLTRHPILWAAAVWGGAHLFPNGELRALLLFGGLCAFSLMGMVLFDRRRRQALGGDWEALQQATRLSAADLPGLIWRGLAGLLLYVALLHLHGPVIGVSPLDIFQ